MDNRARHFNAGAVLSRPRRDRSSPSSVWPCVPSFRRRQSRAWTLPPPAAGPGAGGPGRLAAARMSREAGRPGGAGAEQGLAEDRIGPDRRR